MNLCVITFTLLNYNPYIIKLKLSFIANYGKKALNSFILNKGLDTNEHQIIVISLDHAILRVKLFLCLYNSINSFFCIYSILFSRSTIYQSSRQI